jgi:hypothetical protein
VKILRLWLLVLLAVLLPVRGAMAAAMLCPPAGVGTQQELRTVHDHAGDSHAQAGHHHEGEAHHDEAADPGHDKCNLCSAFCSLTPLLSEQPGVPPPPDAPAASFPDFSAPAPSFLSDGQERPPRSF